MRGVGWAGLDWAGLGAAPRRGRESRGIRRDSPALPGPLGAGGRSVPQGSRLGSGGRKRPKEQAVAGEGGRPEASNPFRGEGERGSLLKSSLSPNYSEGEGLDWKKVMPGRVSFKIVIKELSGTLGLFRKKKKKANVVV